MTALTITTWNINSVRLRREQVERFLDMVRPDVLCLQETKVHNQLFPSGPFATMGYKHQHHRGQKGYHGVAILSRLPLEPLEPPKPWEFCKSGEPRHQAVRVGGVELHNFYVPAGGDEPDPAINPKFAHKLDFLERMRNQFKTLRKDGQPRVLVGDLNVAPGEHDVWSHKQLLKVVSHTPVETDALDRLRVEGGFTDAIRQARPDPEKIFTWWSYRSRDWKASNRGRRLDHIWVNDALSGAVAALGPGALRIDDDCRSWEKPSDHVPVTLSLKMDS